jgi:membrane-associated phospholipid phosphatase
MIGLSLSAPLQDMMMKPIKRPWRMIPFHACIIVLLSVATTCLGFSQPVSALKSRVHPDYYNHHHQGQEDPKGTWRTFPPPTPLLVGRNRRKCNRHPLDSSTAVRMEQSSSSITTTTTTVPKFVFRLNANTKWIITFLHTAALWSRPHRYEGPLIVLGTIVSTYLTQYLKQVINQRRPAGAPFTDPGMPSSHSLISFFIAAAWTPVLLLMHGLASSSATMTVAGATTMTNTMATPLFVFLSLPLSPRTRTVLSISLLWISATLVALLRVICGYHSWAQISVGAVLGTLMGVVWTTLGRQLYQFAPHVTFSTLWIFYLSGAVLFISTTMRNWVTHEKHL